ncbi:MAG: hypothetical protein WC359_12860 [Dehalococcoidia bacterium]|jgi:poly-D-alanine transfer protein DltD
MSDALIGTIVAVALEAIALIFMAGRQVEKENVSQKMLEKVEKDSKEKIANLEVAIKMCEKNMREESAALQLMTLSRFDQINISISQILQNTSSINQKLKDLPCVARGEELSALGKQVAQLQGRFSVDGG